MLCWSWTYLQYKKNFLIFFGPFSLSLGAFALHFRIPLLTLLTLVFFSQLSTSILTTLFTVFNLLMIFQPHDNHLQTGVTNLWAVTHTWPSRLPTLPLILQGSGGFLPPSSPLHPYLHRHTYAKTGERGPHTTLPPPPPLRQNWTKGTLCYSLVAWSLTTYLYTPRFDYFSCFLHGNA